MGAWLLPKIARDQRLAHAAANRGHEADLQNAARNLMDLGAAGAVGMLILCLLIWPVVLLKTPRTLWRLRRVLPRLFS